MRGSKSGKAIVDQLKEGLARVEENFEQDKYLQHSALLETELEKKITNFKLYSSAAQYSGQT